jgi:predicted transcriptional regulator
MSQITTQKMLRSPASVDAVVNEFGRDDRSALDAATTATAESGRARSVASSLSRRSREQIHADILEAIELTSNEASLNRIMMSVFLNRNETRKHLHELVRCRLVTTAAAAYPGMFTAYSLTAKGREILLLHQRIERLYQVSV